MDSTWGASNIDFNYEPPKVYYDSTRIWDFGGTNASICNAEGELQVYTNGQAIYNGQHEVLEDTINYNLQWDNWTSEQDGIISNLGLPTIQGALILPFPDEENKFYAFYREYDLINLVGSAMYYATIGHDTISNEQRVLEQDIPIVVDSIGGGGMNAVKHANGRDWWLLFPHRNNNRIYTFLIDDQGVHDMGIQNLGLQYHEHGLGQGYFSPDGNYFALNGGLNIEPDGGMVSIMQFDRCTGKLSNRIFENIDGYGFSNGLSFSGNNRFLYASNSLFTYQYDLHAEDILASRITIAEYDNYQYFYPEDVDSTFGFVTTLGWMGLAPDGKIYISSSSGGNRKMHVMHQPNAYGEACDLRQHSLHIPTSYARTIPNFPNFRLGPLDGSPCDTLGLNNLPRAKFRCEQDSLNKFKFYFTDLSFYDPDSWSWSFGSQTSDQQNPSFEFEENGTYEVCLTVSNQYDSDTVCKSIQIGTTSSSEVLPDTNVNIFPNPVQSNLLISFHDYFSISADLILFDASMKKVDQFPLKSNWNNLDFTHLPSGIYFYTILDQGRIIKNGKLIKVE